MRVGFDAKRYFNNSTGLGNYARWLIESISQRVDIETYLFHTKAKPESSYIVVSPTGIWKAFKSLWRSRYICSAIEKAHLDIYHGLSNELPFGIHRLNVKTIVTIHDLINLRYPEHYAWFDLFIYKQKLNYAVKHADHIVTPSEQTKQDIVDLLGHKRNNITVIPLSLVAKSEANDVFQHHKPYILCVSSFTKRKNLEKLAKAFDRVADNKVDLIIAGKHGDTYNTIYTQTVDNENITLKINVSNEELSSLYRGSLFCIYPSIFEGFGIPILEAFQYGKTIATSNISSMPEVGGNAALYFDPNSEIEISQAIKTLLSKESRDTYTDRIKTQMQLFQSDVLTHSYYQLYQATFSSESE